MEPVVVISCALAMIVLVLGMTECCIYIRNERYMYNSI